MNKISGTLILTSPLHCSDPGSKDNETQTVKIPLISSMGHRVNVPYFPANDLRGRLRRKAARHIMSALAQEGKLPVELYAGLTSGAVTGKLESSNQTVEEISRGKKNVYMGLFGGGRRLLRTNFKVRDLLPVIGVTIDAGLVPGIEETLIPKKFDTERKVMVTIEPYDLLHKFTFFRVDDVTRLARVDELNEYTQKEEVDAWQERAITETQSRKRDKDIKKNTIANIMVFQSIIPGTRMHFQLDLSTDITEAQMGLLMCSVADLVNENALGGMVRNGCGQFNVDLDDFRVDFDDETKPMFVTGKNNRYDINPDLSRFVDAMKAELHTLTIEGMWSFFRKISEAS